MESGFAQDEIASKSSKFRRLGGFAFVAAFAAVVAWLRWHATQAVPSTMLVEEFALQWRYAKMAATAVEIPSHDLMLQYPEGVWTGKSYPTLMERTTGYCFRVSRQIGARWSFDEFLPIFQAAFSALGVIACFAAASAIYPNRLAAIAATVICGLSSPPALRLVQSFGHETFALPFLFAGVAAMAWTLNSSLDKRPRIACGLLAGIFFFVALGSWHFSRFFVLAVIVAALPAFAKLNVDRRRLWIVAGVLLAVAGVSMSLRNERDSYGHVWELAWDKLRNFGVKPADPKMLSFDSRILWSGVFHGPDPARLLWTMGLVYLPCVLAGLIWLFRRRRSFRRLDPASCFLLGMTAIFFALHLAIDRLAVVAVFFLAIVGGRCWAPGGFGKRIGLPALCLLGLAMLSNFPATPIAIQGLQIEAPANNKLPAERFQPLGQVDHSLLSWARLETPADAVFAGRFNICAPLLAYADRAIALHTKFEVPGIRKKVEAHIAALYGSENDLAQFCEQNGVTHYLHDPFAALGTNADFPRYLGEALKLKTTTPAYLMQFSPEKLGRFEIVYQNSQYRVFRLVKNKPRFETGRFPVSPLFDIHNFPGNENPAVTFDDRGVEDEFARLQEANDRLRQAIGLFAVGRYLEALPIYEAVLAVDASIPYARSHRAIILLRMGRLDESRREIELAVRIDPFEPQSWFHAWIIRKATGDAAGAVGAREACLRVDPQFPVLN